RPEAPAAEIPKKRKTKNPSRIPRRKKVRRRKPQPRKAPRTTVLPKPVPPRKPPAKAQADTSRRLQKSRSRLKFCPLASGQCSLLQLPLKVIHNLREQM